MSRFLIFLSALILISCKLDIESPGETPSIIRRYEPVSLTFEDNERINAICKALRVNTGLLPLYESNNHFLEFSYAHKGCGDAELGPERDVKTQIVKSEGKFIFRPLEGSFGYKEIDTDSEGIIAEICSVPGMRTSPMQTKSGAIWFSTFTNSRYCRSDAKGICILVENGRALDNFNYEIHTREWVKFNTQKDHEGFFSNRRSFSTIGCKAGQQIEKLATLK